MKYCYALLLFILPFTLASQTCVAPSGSITDVNSIATNTSIRGYFTPLPDADSYLIFYGTSPTFTGVLSDGTTYNPGDPIPGNTATQIANSITTAFLVNGLLPSTQYYVFVIPAKKSNCTGGPKYNTQNIQGFPIATTLTPPYNYYYGTLHSHSSYSDGNQDHPTYIPADDYVYAKNSLCMDFLGISEHNHATVGMHLANWQPGLAQARAATTPNFLGLYGMEWGVSSTNNGHIIIYGTNQLLGWETGNYNVYVAQTNYLGAGGIFQTVNSLGPTTFATLAHPYTTDYSNLQAQPYNATVDSALVGSALENGPAFSTDTSYSDDPANMYYLSYYLPMLAKGYHIGPTIDHDNHNTTFGRVNDSRLAVVMPSLDSASFYTAMRNMNFYASQDCDTRVDISLNNMPMGSITSGPTKPAIVITAYDPTNPTASALVKLMKGKPGSGVNATEKTRTVGVAGTLVYTDTSLADNDTAYYYADVYIGGKRSISSPIWYTNTGSIIPLSFLSFSAIPVEGQNVRLNWTTANEVNTRSFEIQRSTDGIHFTTIEQISAMPSQGGSGSYSAFDGNLKSIAYYYRIKQVDHDGKYSYSRIAFIDFNILAQNSFVVLPNPVRAEPVLRLNAREKQRVTITISDVTGKQVYKGSESVEKGFSTIQLSGLNLQKGLYVTTVHFNDGIISAKMVKL